MPTKFHLIPVHVSMHYFIVESVDSNVGIARTRNIWQYKKISENLKNG